MAACTFCGSSLSSVSSPVAGPGVFICDSCVAFARSVIEEADSAVPAAGSAARSSFAELRCSFCDRSAARVRRMVAGPEVRICDRCALSGAG
jgi:ATP-dependent protease Clp ATPase subunit